MMHGKFVFFEKFERKKPALSRAGFFKAGYLVFEESTRRQIPKTIKSSTLSTPPCRGNDSDAEQILK